MLYDPEHRVAANVHCGWRGQVQNILAEAVRRLQTEFGSRPAVLRAGIGPGLGPCCAEFRHYGQEFPRHFWRYQVRPYYFNLWDISRDQLRAAGLQPEHIDISGLCTKCRESEFFSYRRERLSGRQGAIIGLKV
jgi:copper oxidase (laccase) domain-containing protein